MDPSLDALLVEAVHAARQQDADIIGLELHQANRAGCTHVLRLLLQLVEGLLHVQNPRPLLLFQVLAGRQQGLSHESVDLSAGVGEEHDHQKGHEEQVEPNDNYEVVFTDVIERKVIFGGVELLEEFAEHEEHADDDGDFVVEGLLVVHEPTVKDDDVVEADAVGGHSAQVYHVLAQPVLVPVRDGEDQQRQRNQRLHDARQVLLDYHININA